MLTLFFLVQDLSHSWVCSSRRDVQVSAEATQAKVSEAARQQPCYISKRSNTHGVLCWMCIELTVMLHIHYDFSCLFNCPCISSLIFIFSPLRLHQTLTASLWRPVTPKDGVSGVLWLLLSEPSPLPPILSLSECQARRTVDRICNKLEHTLSSTKSEPKHFHTIVIYSTCEARLELPALMLQAKYLKNKVGTSPS